MNNIEELTINWKRSILINKKIDDDLVTELTPTILSLRQESDAPITVGINSPGGSLASLDLLLGLLSGPNQDGKKWTVITVSTNRAYSAAANLLAFGDYSVALKHSQILYHDVRFSGISDVTPEKARDAAKSLQETNDQFALRLAHKIIRRLIWIYLDLQIHFKDTETEYPSLYKINSEILNSYAPSANGYKGIDLAGFATTLWAILSPQNDSLIRNVMDRLNRWITFSKLTESVPTYRPKGSRTPGILDGSHHLYKLFSGKKEHFESIENDLKLFMSLIVGELAQIKSDRSSFSSILDLANREYAILNSMNNPKHIEFASDLLLEHSHVFFGFDLSQSLETMPSSEKDQYFSEAAPHARLFWHFCVLLCRELFEGEHILSPKDAQLLGIVDEIAGGGRIESRREFRIKQSKVEAPSTGAEPSPE